MAVSALAVRRTSHSAVMALAVLLDTVRFLAGAALGWDKSLYAFEVARVPVVRHHFGGFNVLLVSGLVVTTHT